MDSNFKRSFKGYDPVSVSNELSFMDQEFTHKREELRRALETKVQQKQWLNAEIIRLKQEMAPTLAIQDDISRRLVTAHIKASEKVITAIQDMEQIELNLTNVISEHKKELNRLHLVTGKMSNDFMATATHYGTMLRGRKEGETNDKD